MSDFSDKETAEAYEDRHIVWSIGRNTELFFRTFPIESGRRSSGSCGISNI